MRTTTLLVGVIVSCFLLGSASAQPITSPYIFPTKLGTPEWKSLNSFTEKLASCQIPQEILKRLTTEALVETCLDYPMFRNYTAYSDPLGGMERVISGFNGMQELLGRKDAGSFLVKKYLEYDPTTYVANLPDDKIAEFSFKLAGLERLLAHDSVLTSLQTDGRRNLLSLAADRLRKKSKDSRYGPLDTGSSAWLAGRVMIKEQFEDFRAAMESNDRLSISMARCGLSSKEDMDDILRHAEKFLSTKTQDLPR